MGKGIAEAAICTVIALSLIQPSLFFLSLVLAVQAVIPVDDVILHPLKHPIDESFLQNSLNRLIHLFFRFSIHLLTVLFLFLFRFTTNSGPLTPPERADALPHPLLFLARQQRAKLADVRGRAVQEGRPHPFPLLLPPYIPSAGPPMQGSQPAPRDDGTRAPKNLGIHTRVFQTPVAYRSDRRPFMGRGGWGKQREQVRGQLPEVLVQKLYRLRLRRGPVVIGKRKKPTSPDPSPSFTRPDFLSTPPTLHSCRWAWCCLNFATNPELVHHVIHDHVMTSVPVRRRDISILRRVEDGIGDSLNLSDAMRLNSIEVVNGNDGMNTASSSFVSFPHSPNEPRCRTHTPGPSSPPNTRAISRRRSRPPSPPMSSIAPPPHKKTARYPTPPSFASLSSPLGSPAIPSLPPSPSFNELVWTSTTRETAREKSGPASPKRASPSNENRSRHTEHALSDDSPGGAQNRSAPAYASFGSQVSTSSPETVERQLTQSANESVVDDRGEAETFEDASAENADHSSSIVPNRRPDLNSQVGGQTDADAVFRTLPEGSAMGSDPPLETPPQSPELQTPFLPAAPIRVAQAQRQTWYQPPSSYSILRDKGRRNLGYGMEESPSQAPDPLNSATPPDQRGDQEVGCAPDVSPGVLSHAEGPSDSQSQWSESSSVGSCLDTFSYPLLQTQAPYQSQSLTQTQASP